MNLKFLASKLSHSNPVMNATFEINFNLTFEVRYINTTKLVKISFIVSIDQTSLTIGW